MEITTQIKLENMTHNKVKKQKSNFLSEFAKGYLWAGIDKKEEYLANLTNAFNKTEDKESFKAEYLEALIFSLKADLEEDKKLLSLV